MDERTSTPGNPLRDVRVCSGWRPDWTRTGDRALDRTSIRNGEPDAPVGDYWPGGVTRRHRNLSTLDPGTLGRGFGLRIVERYAPADLVFRSRKAPAEAQAEGRTEEGLLDDQADYPQWLDEGTESLQYLADWSEDGESAGYERRRTATDVDTTAPEQYPAGRPSTATVARSTDERRHVPKTAAPDGTRGRDGAQAPLVPVARRDDRGQRSYVPEVDPDPGWAWTRVDAGQPVTRSNHVPDADEGEGAAREDPTPDRTRAQFTPTPESNSHGTETNPSTARIQNPDSTSYGTETDTSMARTPRPGPTPAGQETRWSAATPEPTATDEETDPSVEGTAVPGSTALAVPWRPRTRSAGRQVRVHQSEPGTVSRTVRRVESASTPASPPTTATDTDRPAPDSTTVATVTDTEPGTTRPGPEPDRSNVGWQTGTRDGRDRGAIDGSGDGPPVTVADVASQGSNPRVRRQRESTTGATKQPDLREDPDAGWTNPGGRSVTRTVDPRFDDRLDATETSDVASEDARTPREGHATRSPGVSTPPARSPAPSPSPPSGSPLDREYAVTRGDEYADLSGHVTSRLSTPSVLASRGPGGRTERSAVASPTVAVTLREEPVTRTGTPAGRVVHADADSGETAGNVHADAKAASSRGPRPVSSGGDRLLASRAPDPKAGSIGGISQTSGHERPAVRSGGGRLTASRTPAAGMAATTADGPDVSDGPVVRDGAAAVGTATATTGERGHDRAASRFDVAGEPTSTASALRPGTAGSAPEGTTRTARAVLGRYDLSVEAGPTDTATVTSTGSGPATAPGDSWSGAGPAETTAAGGTAGPSARGSPAPQGSGPRVQSTDGVVVRRQAVDGPAPRTGGVDTAGVDTAGTGTGVDMDRNEVLTLQRKASRPAAPSSDSRVGGTGRVVRGEDSGAADWPGLSDSSGGRSGPGPTGTLANRLSGAVHRRSSIGTVVTSSVTSSSPAPSVETTGRDDGGGAAPVDSIAGQSRHAESGHAPSGGEWTGPGAGDAADGPARPDPVRSASDPRQSGGDDSRRRRDGSPAVERPSTGAGESRTDDTRHATDVAGFVAGTGAVDEGTFSPKVKNRIDKYKIKTDKTNEYNVASTSMESSTARSSLVYRTGEADETAGRGGSAGETARAAEAGVHEGRHRSRSMATGRSADAEGVDESAVRGQPGQRGSATDREASPHRRAERRPAEEASTMEGRNAGTAPGETQSSQLPAHPTRTASGPDPVDSHHRTSVGSGESPSRDGATGQSRRNRRATDVQFPDEQLRYGADVDRLVDRLYRKLERKQRIERERRGKR